MSTFHVDFEFRCFFINSGMEVLGNCGSTDKGCDPKILLLSWILHQCMHSSFLYRTCTRNIASGENHSGGPSVHSFGDKFKTNTLFLVRNNELRGYSK